MINLLLMLLFLACLGVTAAWVAENPGDVVIRWFDWRIDTSFAFLLLAGITSALALSVVLSIIRWIIVMPARISHARRLKQYRRGLTEITHSVAALAVADAKNAETHTRKAEKILGRTPLTLLLAAQVARSQGDDARTRLLLEKMLEHNETAYLAARSLCEAASKQKLFPRALQLAQRAYATNPKDATMLIGLHLRLNQYQEALAVIDKATRKGHISRNAQRRYRGLAHLQQGRLLPEGTPAKTRLAFARSVLKELPDFVPAILFSARAYAEAGQQVKAEKILFNAWKKSPHPQLAALLSALTHDAPAKRTQKFASVHAEYAPDVMWVCHGCGHAEQQWEVHCTACGAFDTLEWKKREIKFAA